MFSNSSPDCNYFVVAEKYIYIYYIKKSYESYKCILSIYNIKCIYWGIEVCVVMGYRLKTTWMVWQTFQIFYLDRPGTFREKIKLCPTGGVEQNI